MEKKYRNLLIVVAIALVLCNLYIFHYFKMVGMDPSITKMVLGISIPVQIIVYCLIAWFFHKVSKK